MGLIVAIVVLTLGCFAFIFWPQRHLFKQADKTLVDSLGERKEAIYENLRDLNFEHLAGKYTEADYIEQRRALEDEAAKTISETEALTASGMKSRQTKA